MKRLFFHISLIAIPIFLISITSCNNTKTDTTNSDSIHDTITDAHPNDTLRTKFKKLVAAMPVPFEMLKKFSGAKLPCKPELLNNPDHASSYNSASLQSLNLGIYGADLAYLISQDKLGDGAPYLKAIRRLSDAVVIPSAFNPNMLSRYENNQDKKDSMQGLIQTSYKQIDSSLQGNDRLALAALVLTGGWLESIYLTTQHIGEESQNEKNKVLFDMLASQQPYLENITELLGSFPEDNLCKSLFTEFQSLKTDFPKGADISSKEFALKLAKLRIDVASFRNHYVSIQ
ncbi:hypothetical protein BH09BAC5_BH09BAC5_29560 [soil metagenome]